jgi:hypothetical protein
MKAGTVEPGFADWLAYKLQVGEVFVHHLSARQARALTGARCADLAAVHRANRRSNGRNGNGSKRRVFYRRVASDADLDGVIQKLGPNKVMQALDRLTKPRCERTTEMFSAAR